jgi:DNA-binding IclR family transcriptional regulator
MKMGENTTVDSDERMLNIIEALKERTSAGVTELADALEMPKSTVHVHLSTLKERGYVVQDESHEYRLSLRFLDMGTTIRQTQDMYDEVVPKLKQLAEETEEKAWWTVEENGKAVFIAKAVGSRAIRTNAYIGQHIELYRLAAGKSILANLPDDRKNAIINGYEFPLADGSSREDLERELAEIREMGVAYGTERFLQGVSGVGVPLKDNAGNVYGAISVSGPTNRLDSDRVENELTNLVRGISGELRVSLSYR